MAIYKHIDSRNLAFLLATVFLVLFAVGPEIPTYFFNYIPIICGSLAFVLYGIYTSSHNLFWPILITTGFFTIVYGFTSVTAWPYLFVPEAMLNWGRCEGFLTYLNCSGSEDVGATVVAIADTASCYKDIQNSEAYVIPFVCTVAFGISFFVFLKSKMRVKEEKSPELPPHQKKASVDPLTIQMMLGLTFLIFVVIFVSRTIGWFLRPNIFSTVECIGSLLILIVLAVSTIFADDFRAPFFAVIFYSAVKAVINLLYATHLIFYMKPDQWSVCFSILDSLDPMLDSNGIEFNAVAIAANSCFQRMRGATSIDVVHSLLAAVFFTLLFFFYEAIYSLDDDIFEEAKKEFKKNSPANEKMIIDM